MDHLESAQVLGLFGGTLAGLSWLPTILLTFSLSYFLMSVFGVWFVLLPILTGFCVCGLSFRAAAIAPKVPQRAKQEFYAAGWLGIAIGMLFVGNILLMLSSIFVLIAGAETSNGVEGIVLARRRTGFPFSTVATAAASLWHRRLSCSYCGAPLVVTAVSPRRPDVQVEARCPLDGIHDRQRLPLSQLEEWAPVLADRLHRCTRCGERTAVLLMIHQGVLYTTLRSVCPGQHSTPFRRIWTPIYSHVAQAPAVDVGYQPASGPSRFYPTIRVYGAPGAQPVQSFTPPPVAWSAATAAQPTFLPRPAATPSRAAYPTQFCRVCGITVESDDRFCYNCGAAIR